MISRSSLIAAANEVHNAWVRAVAAGAPRGDRCAKKRALTKALAALEADRARYDPEPQTTGAQDTEYRTGWDRDGEFWQGMVR